MVSKYSAIITYFSLYNVYKYYCKYYCSHFPDEKFKIYWGKKKLTMSSPIPYPTNLHMHRSVLLSCCLNCSTKGKS